MKPGKTKFGDKKLEIWMGNMLRYGVLISGLFVLTGAVIYLVQHGSEKPVYQLFSGEPLRFTNLKLIIENAWRGQARSIIQLGLLLLIATPIARIIFSIVGFLMEKDYLYVIITTTVLAIIIASLLL
ncbi:MAG: DUF1634 domain-containing protein [Ginsengibacter sp.]